MTERGRKKRYDGGVLHVRLPAGILERIDERAKKAGLTRSDWARERLAMLVTAEDDAFRAMVEKAIEPFKPVFERFGEVLKEEAERNPDLGKDVDKALRTMLEELLSRTRRAMAT